MRVFASCLLVLTVVPHFLCDQDTAAPCHDGKSEPEHFSIDPIRPVATDVTDREASDWLDQHEQENNHGEEQIEYALSLAAHRKLSVDVRQRSLELASLWMRMEEFPERADRLACRLLSTDGDTILQHMAIMQSMSYGLSGSYVLRKYSEIMLRDRGTDFAVDKDEISPSGSIRLYGVSNLVLRKCVTAEAAINQMLLLAAMPEASPGCRGCAFAIIADVARLAPIMQEVVPDATRRDMYDTAESAVCDDGLTDEVRAAAIDVWSSNLWLNNGMSRTAPTDKLVIACVEIVKDESHSLHLRSRGLGVLKESPEQFMSVAAGAALAVIPSEAGDDMERRPLLNAAFECLSECGTGSDSECEVIQNFAERPTVTDGARRRAVRLLDKWRASK